MLTPEVLTVMMFAELDRTYDPRKEEQGISENLGEIHEMLDLFDDTPPREEDIVVKPRPRIRRVTINHVRILPPPEGTEGWKRWLVQDATNRLQRERERIQLIRNQASEINERVVSSPWLRLV